MTRHTPIIAVDFDGTIVTNAFPDIGQLRAGAADTLRRWKDKGWRIIIWTCRGGEAEDACRRFLDRHDIPYDTINENVADLWFETSRKVYADVYIDDRAHGSIDWEQLADLEVT